MRVLVYIMLVQTLILWMVSVTREFLACIYAGGVHACSTFCIRISCHEFLTLIRLVAINTCLNLFFSFQFPPFFPKFVLLFMIFTLKKKKKKKQSRPHCPCFPGYPAGMGICHENDHIHHLQFQEHRVLTSTELKLQRLYPVQISELY